LLAIFGNFVNRTLVLTHKYFGGTVPPVATHQGHMNLTPEDMATLDAMQAFPEKIMGSLDNYRFREGLAEMMNLARLGNKFLTDAEPWKLFKDDPERVKTILNISLQICANLAILCEPFLPFTAEKLLNMLNISKPAWSSAGTATILEAGHTIREPQLLFEKIEDDAIDRQVQKLLITRQQNDQPAGHIPFKAPISYDDFSKMDIRLATIIKAEKVAKTKKLIKLELDTGLDKRTVVSGIAGVYEPESLTGKKVLLLANLEPRTIKGITSHGMLLLAENREGNLAFIVPEKNFPEGSPVN